MRKLLLFFWCMMLFAFSSNAQTHLSEDFSTATMTTPPTGWTQNVIAGDPLVDLWQFDNPVGRTLNAPISDPAAIFDSDGLSNNSQAEDVALESPAFDASAVSQVLLSFDHYFQNGFGGGFNVEIFDGNSWITVLSDSGASTPNPQSVNLDISAQAAGVSNAQIRFRWTGNYSWYWIVDNITVFTPFANDLGIVSIDSPTDPDPTNCNGLSNAEQITISIKNFGSVTQSSFNLSWSVLGPGSPVTALEPVFGVSIPPDSTVSYSFTGIAATADMSTFGMYTVIGRVSLTGDQDSTNDTTFVMIDNPAPLIAPFTEDFETGTAGSGGTGTAGPGVLPMGWSRTNQSNYQWQVNDGTTSSTNTGPTVDHTFGTSTGIYMYTEASTGSAGDTAELIGPCLDISAVASPFLSFWYHMFGDDMGTLEVIVSSGGVETVVQTISGEQQTSNAEDWRQSLVDLSSFSGTIQIIMRGISAGIFDGDIAIDDLEVVDLPANDIGITAITAPIDGMGCDGLSASENVTVTIQNFGAAPQTGFPLGYLVGTVGLPTIEVYGGAPIPAGGSVTYTFTATADLSTPGLYQIGAATGLLSDADNSNDTTVIVVNNPIPLPAPIVEDFETGTPGSGGTGTAGPGILPMGWSRTSQSAYQWQVNDGTTSSTSTGPNVDHTLGTSSGIYMYTESSSGSAGDTAELMSACIDISNVANPYISYWYHMYGAEIGTLEIIVYSNGVETVVETITGEQQTSNGEDWRQSLVDIGAFSGGSIQLVLRAIGAGTFNGDIAIDDIGIVDIPPFDMAVTDILAPEFGCFDTTLEEILVEITNTGTDTIDLFNDTLTIILTASGANMGADTLILGGSGLELPPGESYDPLFPFMVDLSNPGITTLTVSIDYTSDGDSSNDTLHTDVITQPTISSYPYFEDFESGPGGWVAGGENSTWAFGTPAKTVIMGAASGSNAWVTGGLGTTTYDNNEASSVQGPCFDMSNAPAGAWVAMKIWFESENGFDGAALQSSIDSGATWQLVGAFGAPNNWYNDDAISGNPGGQGQGWTGRNGVGSNGWVQASHPLDSSLTGAADVRFRVAFGSDISVTDDGFAFDDFAIGVPPTVALGADTASYCIGEQLDAGSGFDAYLWSTGDSTQAVSIVNMTGMNIMDSTISVTVVDSLGLSGSDTVVVNIFGATPPAITATLLTNVLCSGDSTGAIDLTVTGDATPFTFTWDNGATEEDLMNVPAGSYSVTVADTNGCSVASSSFSISQPEPLNLTDATAMDVDCPDDSTGSIMITVTGGTAPYSYAWSNGDTTQNLAGIPVGAYVGTVTDSNMCVLVSDTVNIASTGMFPADVAIADTLAGGGTVDFSGSSTGGDTYVWDFGDGSDPDSTQNPSHTYASNDTFTVTLTVTNSCGSMTASKTVILTSVGIADYLLSQHVNVYPNPNQGFFEIRFSDIQLQEVAVVVSTVEGKRIYARSLGDIGGAFTHQVTLPANTAQGMYILQVNTVDAVMHKRLIVE